MTRRPEAYDGPARRSAPTSPTRRRCGPRSRRRRRDLPRAHPSTTRTSSARTPRPRATSAGAAAEAGSSRSSTWGGSATTTRTSPAHLRSRREVETLLAADGVPVTVLRAAIVVATAAFSWEIHPPAGQEPARDGRAALGQHPHPADRARRRGALPRRRVGHADALGRTFEIGGPEQLTYKTMLEIANDVAGGRPLVIVDVPGADAAAVVVLAGPWSPTSTSRPGATSSTRWPPRWSCATTRSARSCRASRCPTDRGRAPRDRRARRRVLTPAGPSADQREQQLGSADEPARQRRPSRPARAGGLRTAAEG